MLKKALEWGVIAQMPCTIRLLKTGQITTTKGVTAADLSQLATIGGLN